jgi:alpha-N-acetylglucosaminidase
MSGDLATIQLNLQEVLESKESGRLSGIGMMMEGLGYNPILQEFITEKNWRPEPIDLEEWVKAYARRRYGSNDFRLAKVWQLLLQGPYSRNITNGYESIICSTPQLTRFIPMELDRFGVGYDAIKVAEACRLLLDCSQQLKNIASYRFDVAHVTREMLSNLANYFNYNIVLAYQNKNEDALADSSKIFLQLIQDMDQLLGTNEHFLLGKWITDARKWGTTEARKDFYEWNARSLITMWEPAKKSQLRDYASKQWNGLLRDFYLPRWKIFLDALAESLRENRRLEKRKFLNDLKEFEFQWIHDKRSKYSSQPIGDTLEVAFRLFKKYVPYYRNQ